MSDGSLSRFLGSSQASVVIKTLDALHLASAQVFSEGVNEERVLIFSHDAGMNRCALALGFTAPFYDEQ